MQDALLHILTVWSIWTVLAWSNVPVYKGLRDHALTKYPALRELVQCPLCFGFWISLVVVSVIPHTEHWFTLLWCGSGGTFILEKVITRLEGSH
jgi:hypothetical protein